MYFFCKLLPPRPTFASDMSPDEKQAMGRHVEYWTEQAKLGVAIVFGPVADPKGSWGLAVLSVSNNEQVESLLAQDPVILANIGAHYERIPMPQAVHGLFSR